MGRKAACRTHPFAGLPGATSQSSRQEGEERKAQGRLLYGRVKLRLRALLEKPSWIQEKGVRNVDTSEG